MRVTRIHHDPLTIISPTLPLYLHGGMRPEPDKPTSSFLTLTNAAFSCFSMPENWSAYCRQRKNLQMLNIDSCRQACSNPEHEGESCPAQTEAPGNGCIEDGAFRR
ncbi:MAG: hypothetical protein MI685_06195 [Chlorobiales bacterium]|nr:hypothetical protein [Chlorobiales bacterium]